MSYNKFMKKIQKNTIEIINTLKERNETITFAESCTGGRIASEFTNISGASSVLMGSVISYSNEIKSKWLGVKEKTLMAYGAVSKETVEEMLSGILKMASANHAIAVSGIAGPTGGTEEKPVGTVYIGIKNNKKSIVQHCLFKGSRKEIQKQATQEAIMLLKKNL
jgi:nicotinamide-nucleotide amidase